MTRSGAGPFLVLAGPTGVGKTEVSIAMAQALGAEILSADSRQVYRELEIGTAKPSPDQLAEVAHHFVDELSIGESWSAGKFASQANERIQEMADRGVTPLIVGGSTLYLSALVHGMADMPEPDPVVRAELNEQARSPEGRARLFEELLRVDPEGARRLDDSKTQRLVRALEVYRSTGKTWSSFTKTTAPPPFSYHVVVLTREREELYARIEARVDAMLRTGLLDENRRLMATGHRRESNPLRTIGYREPLAYLAGEIDYEEMVRLLKRNTRRYAKRQLTWFRNRADYRWVNASDFASHRMLMRTVLETRS